MSGKNINTLNVLLIGYNPGDIRSINEAPKGTDLNSILKAVMDGKDALEFLDKQGKFIEINYNIL